MEATSNCEKCKKISPDSPLFSCGHTICQLCIIKILFSEHLNELAAEDQIQIKCRCKSGIKDFSVSSIAELISKLSVDATPRLCILHNAQIKLSCVECNNSFCEKCIDIHKEINPHHQLTENEIDFVKCNLHPRHYRELYCNNCQEEVCQVCIIKGSKHFDHTILAIEDYANQLKSRIPSQYYLDVSAPLNHIEQIANNFKEKVYSLLNKFDELIKQLEESKAIYRDMIKQTIERANIITTITKIVYSNFKKCKTTLDISFLQEISNLKYDMNRLELQKDNEKLISLEEKMNELKDYYNTLKVQPIHITWRRNGTWKNMMTLTEHSDHVYPLIHLKDGRIVSGSKDKTIKVWEDFEMEFRNSLTLNGHTDTIFSLVAFKDGRILSGSYDTTIKVWELAETFFWNTLTLTGHTETVDVLIQLKDGRLASGSRDKTIKIWEVNEKDYRNIVTLTEHSDYVLSLLQLSDGRMASGSRDKTIKVWEAGKKEEFKNTLTLTGHNGMVLSIIQLKDGKIASGSTDKTIKIWELSNNTFKNTLTLIGHSSSIRSVIELNDGQIASGSDDKTIKLWDLGEKDFRNTLTLTGHNDWIITLIQLKDGRIASSSCDKTIKVWEIE